MNNREKVLTVDFRPRVDEKTDDEIRRIAARDGVQPNVLIRKWILEGIRRDEQVKKVCEEKGMFFSLRRFFE